MAVNVGRWPSYPKTWTARRAPLLHLAIELVAPACQPGLGASERSFDGPESPVGHRPAFELGNDPQAFQYLGGEPHREARTTFDGT